MRRHECKIPNNDFLDQETAHPPELCNIITSFQGARFHVPSKANVNLRMQTATGPQSMQEPKTTQKKNHRHVLPPLSLSTSALPSTNLIVSSNTIKSLSNISAQFCTSPNSRIPFSALSTSFSNFLLSPARPLREFSSCDCWASRAAALACRSVARDCRAAE